MNNQLIILPYTILMLTYRAALVAPRAGGNMNRGAASKPAGRSAAPAKGDDDDDFGDMDVTDML